MSSLIRRIQRMSKRTSVGSQKRSIRDHFGDKVGVHNEEAKDLLSRKKREERNKTR